MKNKVALISSADHHHLIEDVGIVLGRAIDEALGEKRGIARFGSMMVPLDDALIACSVDLSGRSYLNFDVRFAVEDLADLKTGNWPGLVRQHEIVDPPARKAFRLSMPLPAVRPGAFSCPGQEVR